MKSMAEHFNEEAKRHEDNFINKMGMADFYDEVELQIDKCSYKTDILILGCGTGLEVERIKHKANVLAIDIAEEMLNELRGKELHQGISLDTICGSLFDVNYGTDKFDIVLTCYVTHHFNEEQKLLLYKKVYDCLRDGGSFINGDSMAKTKEDEVSRFDEAEKIYKEQGLPFGSLHIDIPFCYEHELTVLNKAGFCNIILEREWQITKLYRVIK